MRQKILMVGPSSRLRRFEPLLRRVSVEAIRLPEPEPAISVAQELPVDLVVAVLPAGGLGEEAFVAAIRAPGSASRGAKILVLGEAATASKPPSGKAAFDLVPLEAGSENAGEVLSRFLRKAPRARTWLMVRLDLPPAAGGLHRILQVRNLSRGGLLVRSNDPFPLGTEVDFDLTLPAGEAVRGRAKVVRHADPESDRVDGMGLCFSRLEGGDERRLQSYLDELISSRGGSKAPAEAR